MVKMVISEVQTQTEQVKTFGKTYGDALESVSTATGGVMLAMGLSGKGMDSIKGYISSAYPALCKAAILHSESVLQANEEYLNGYKSQCGSKDLDSEELEEQIRETDNLIQKFQSSKDSFAQAKQSLSEDHATLMGMFFQAAMNSMDAGITRNQAKKSKLEEKLQKFIAFCDQSTSYFDTLNDTGSLLKKGMLALGVNGDGSVGLGSWNGNGFSLKDTAWIKEVNKNWKKRQVRIEEQQMLESLKEIAEVNSSGDVTSVRWQDVAKLLLKDPNDLTDAEKAALQKIYDYVTKNLKDVNAYERELFGLFAPLISPMIGFEYNSDGDYYYTNKHSIQSHGGFGDFYDEMGFLLGMDLDTEIVTFDANGKEYRLQLWKGAYGFGRAYGAEIGLYYKNPDGKELDTKIQSAIPGWYACVEEQDQLKMKNTIYDKNSGERLIINDTRDYAEDKTHFWNLAIKTDSGYSKEDLLTRSEIEIPDKSMREAMIEALKKTGNIINIKEKGDVVEFTWKN